MKQPPVLKFGRIVELSHRMVSGQDEFPLQMKTFNLGTAQQ